MGNRQNSLQETKEQGRRVLVVELSQQLTWSRSEAATMCGVSSNMFSNWVREGFMPQPLRNGRFSADAVRNRLSASNDSPDMETAYDHWKKVS